MQKLLLSHKFLESLEYDEKVIKTMRIYSYFSKNQFLDALMELLNMHCYEKVGHTPPL